MCAQEAGSFKAVNKDLWSMMLEFLDTIKPDLSNYDVDEGVRNSSTCFHDPILTEIHRHGRR